MSLNKMEFELAVMRELVKARAFIELNKEKDDSVTGYGHELERERGRIEGLQKALEFFEISHGKSEE